MRLGRSSSPTLIGSHSRLRALTGGGPGENRGSSSRRVGTPVAAIQDCEISPSRVRCMSDNPRSDDQPTIDVANADLLLSTTRSVRKRLDFERPVERGTLLQILELAARGA